MTAYLCRWPNGVLSILAGDSQEEVVEALSYSGVCSVEEAVGENAKPGIIMPLPKGLRIHLHLTDGGGFEFRGFPDEAIETLRTLYPHLIALTEQPFKTKKAALAAAKKVVDIECGREK